MPKFLRTSVAVLALSVAAPLASMAQGGGATPAQCAAAGLTYVNIGGVGYCTFNAPPSSSAPEIGTSASYAGLAVLLCGGLMLRGRRRAKSVVAGA